MKNTNKILIGSFTGMALVASGMAIKAQSLPLRPAAAQPSPSTGAYQRFIPMPRQPENVTGVPWSGAFALDTKTGQLCRTYDGGLDEKWSAITACADLYKKF
jgi:hypothetical protein